MKRQARALLRGWLLSVVIVLLVFWITLGKLKRRRSQLGVSDDAPSAPDDQPGRASD